MAEPVRPATPREAYTALEHIITELETIAFIVDWMADEMALHPDHEGRARGALAYMTGRAHAVVGQLGQQFQAGWDTAVKGGSHECAC